MSMIRIALLAMLGCLVAQGCQGKSGPESSIELIKKLGGKIKTNNDLPGQPVVMVDLRDTAVSDDQLSCLKELPQMQILVLDGTGISDAGLVTLKECSLLQRLFLRNTRVSAEGIEDLKKTLPKAEIVN